MGNRAIITTSEKRMGVYMHWSGERGVVEPLLKYCELQGYRPPNRDCYGWARLAQVLGNYFGGGLSVGVDAYERLPMPDDNGVYITEDWRIVDRIYPFTGYVDETDIDFDEALHVLDASMPKRERLGRYLDTASIPLSQLEVGDEVWLRDGCYGMRTFGVLGFPEDGNAGRAPGDLGQRRRAVELEDAAHVKTRRVLCGEACRITPRTLQTSTAGAAASGAVDADGPDSPASPDNSASSDNSADAGEAAEAGAKVGTAPSSFADDRHDYRALGGSAGWMEVAL